MITVKLTHGLTYQDKTVAEIRLKPLSVGGELAAFALIDDLPELPEHATKAQLLQRDVLETLTYWSQQIEADGIPSDILTAQWLMDNRPPRLSDCDGGTGGLAPKTVRRYGEPCRAVGGGAVNAAT